MADIEVLDDPIWEYMLHSKLVDYIPKVREFWAEIDTLEVTGTGVYPVTGSNVPAGLMYRTTNTAVRSPIKNVQVFPFVPTSYLNLTNVAGGANRMISRVCAGNRFTIEEFTIVEKSHLPSTYHQSQFVAFVPTEIIEGTKELGHWVYMTVPEMISIKQGTPVKSVIDKMKVQL